MNYIQFFSNFYKKFYNPLENVNATLLPIGQTEKIPRAGFGP